MIRVAVVDDEPLVRTGLRVILDSADDMTVVVESGAAGALEAVTSRPVDVLLLDIRMPEADGISLLRQITERPDAPVVAMLTSFGRDTYVDEALRAGAAGFLLKNAAPQQLVLSVRSLAAGRRVLAPEATSQVIAGYLASGQDREEARRMGTLSAREREVLTHVGHGRTNSDIARRMHLSPGTVKDHVSAILAKLGGLNRVQAAVLADRAQLLRSRPGRL
ncbi:response regulator [Streptomyces sp. NPDC048111]|uniref:response regulator n=1 Tax=Streptomyces sp. NPDC048111 TaxID=3365500 RepID=UPI003715F122